MKCHRHLTWTILSNIKDENAIKWYSPNNFFSVDTCISNFFCWFGMFLILWDNIRCSPKYWNPHRKSFLSVLNSQKTYMEMSSLKQVRPIISIGNGQAWMTTTNRVWETLYYLPLRGGVGNRCFYYLILLLLLFNYFHREWASFDDHH